MSPPRLGFLLPSYGAGSKSQLPVVMDLLRQRGAVVDVVRPPARVIDLSQLEVEHDLYVLKKISGLALSLAGALHSRGATIINPYPTTLALTDKVILFRTLQAAGIPIPATYVAARAEQLAALLEQGPLVIKPHNGTGGHGVRVVRTPAELAGLPADQDPVFAQRYHPPQGRDRKLYVIGERVFGVKKVFPARTDEEKYGEAFTPDPELCVIAHRCGRAFGIDLFGVDIVESSGRPYVVDMSSIPGFKGVPDAPRRLADYFYRAALAAGGTPPPVAIPEPAGRRNADGWH